VRVVLGAVRSAREGAEQLSLCTAAIVGFAAEPAHGIRWRGSHMKSNTRRLFNRVVVIIAIAIAIVVVVVVVVTVVMVMIMGVIMVVIVGTIDDASSRA